MSIIATVKEKLGVQKTRREEFLGPWTDWELPLDMERNWRVSRKHSMWSTGDGCARVTFTFRVEGGKLEVDGTAVSSESQAGSGELMGKQKRVHCRREL